MAKKKTNAFKNFFEKLGNYLVGVFHQAKKVRWPDREVLVKTSIIVIGFAAAFGIYLGLCNAIILWMFRVLGMNI